MNKLINESNVTFNVEKVKLNKLPRHFNDTDRENKTMTIDGRKVKVLINRERTQYVAFTIGDQNYYVRSHEFFDTSNTLKTVVKAKSEATVKSESDATV